MHEAQDHRVLASEQAVEQLALGSDHYREGRPDEAVVCFERALAIEPGQGRAAHFLDVMRGVHAPRPPRRYVRDLFDAYADRFDRHLLGRLQYRGPDVLAAALARVMPAGRAPGDTLDLGCGTGLFAAKLRPLSRRLTGVDLSPRMLARARRLGLYDALEERDQPITSTVVVLTAAGA